MQVLRSSFYHYLFSYWNQEPSYRKVFTEFESALKGIGAKDFTYYRNDDKNAKYHLAMRCDLDGHRIEIAKFTKEFEKSESSGVMRDYQWALFIDGKNAGGYKDASQVLSRLNETINTIKNSINKLSLRSSSMGKQLIRSVEEVTDDFVEYLQTHGTSQEDSADEFCPYQLAMGVLVELEHTDDFDVAEEIAKDHLVEDAEYYGKFDFPEEAISVITDTVDDYEASEALEEVDSWRTIVKNAFARALPEGASGLFVAPYLFQAKKQILDSSCIVISSTAADVAGRTVQSVLSEKLPVYVPTTAGGFALYSNADGTVTCDYPVPFGKGYIREKRTLGSDMFSCTVRELVDALGLNPVYQTPVVSTLDNLPETRKYKIYTIPVAASHNVQPIQSISMKLAEKYYQSGLLTRKELIAILVRENEWTENEANIIADFWDRIDSSQRGLVQIRASETATGCEFEPSEGSELACELADAMNDTFTGDSPSDFVLEVSEEALKQAIPVDVTEVELEFGTEVASALAGLTLGATDNEIFSALSGVDTDVSQVIFSLRRHNNGL